MGGGGEVFEAGLDEDVTRGVGHEVKGGAQHGGVLAKGDHARDGERAGGAEGALNSVLALDGVCGGENTTGGFLAEDERRRGGAPTPTRQSTLYVGLLCP